MIIRTNYPNSISYSVNQEYEMSLSEYIEVRSKATDRTITKLESSEVLANGKHVWLKDEYGQPYQSTYKVFSF